MTKSSVILRLAQRAEGSRNSWAVTQGRLCALNCIGEIPRRLRGSG